ncbi:hypothetical protein D1872_210980 [compost metagenome]
MIQAIRIGHDSVTSIIAERLLCFALVSDLLSIWTVFIRIRNCTIQCGQRYRAATTIIVVRLICTASILPTQ